MVMAVEDNRAYGGGIAVLNALRGKLLHNEPLAKYTSWRVGGPADRFYRPADREDLKRLLVTLPADEPLFWMGLGSNLLVRDGGFRGTVIHTAQCLNVMRSTACHRLYVESGVPCAHVARYCAQRGWSGAEFLAGIPGTMGGALAMNAGAFGGETWRLVEQVTTVDRAGRCHIRTADAFDVGYRSVKVPEGEWFLAADLLLPEGDPDEASQKIRSLLAQRAQTQPIGAASCGSVFRNPPGDYAARLIECCGLKGFCIGGACISEKHANFILNIGGASAADIEDLIRHVMDEVERQQGVRLETEVRIVGEPETAAGDA